MVCGLNWCRERKDPLRRGVWVGSGNNLRVRGEWKSQAWVWGMESEIYFRRKSISRPSEVLRKSGRAQRTRVGIKPQALWGLWRRPAVKGLRRSYWFQAGEAKFWFRYARCVWGGTGFVLEMQTESHRWWSHRGKKRRGRRKRTAERTLGSTPVSGLGVTSETK